MSYTRRTFNQSEQPLLCGWIGPDVQFVYIEHAGESFGGLMRYLLFGGAGLQPGRVRLPRRLTGREDDAHYPPGYPVSPEDRSYLGVVRGRGAQEQRILVKVCETLACEGEFGLFRGRLFCQQSDE